MPRFAGVPIDSMTPNSSGSPDERRKPRFAGVPIEAAAPTAGPTGYDASLPAQGLSGLNEGIANMLGAPVDTVNMGLRAGAAGLHAVGGPDIELPVDAIGGSQSIKNAMGGAIKAPTTDGTGQVVRRIGQEVGASLIPGLRGVAAAERPIATAGAQLGAAVAAGTGAAAADQIAPGNPYADLAGEILGGGGFVGAAKVGLGKLASPMGGIPADRAGAVNTLKSEGVDLTAGQATGNKRLQYTESMMGGGAAQDFTEKQQQQFTQAALAKAGVAAPKATPEVMDKAFTDVGARFDALAAGNTMQGDAQMGADLSHAFHEYQDLALQQAPIVKKTAQRIVDDLTASGGTLSGEQYQNYRSQLERWARGAGDNTQLADALRGMRAALDDAMERSIAKNNPSQLGEWQQARSDYRNLLVIEQAVGRQGEATANGLITPANLASAAKTIQGKRAFVRGQGDFSGLAQAGVTTMTPLPNSGTAQRLGALGVLPAVGSAAALAATGQVVPALGVIGGLAAPRIAGALMLSQRGRNWLMRSPGAGGGNVGSALVGPTVASLTKFTSEASTPSGQASDPSMPAGTGGPNGPLQLTVQGANNALTTH